MLEGVFTLYALQENMVVSKKADLIIGIFYDGRLCLMTLSSGKLCDFIHMSLMSHLPHLSHDTCVR
jgi:hypothetical protein